MAAKKTGDEKIVLVPTDFSDVCRNAIYHGVKLARNRGFRVIILHVITKETKSMLKKMQVGAEYVEWKLNQYRKYYEKKYGVGVETLALEGDLYTTINEIAEKTGATMTLLGTHGRKGLQHVFGSHMLRVVLESPVPAIVMQKISYREMYRKFVFPLPDHIEPEVAVSMAKTASGLFGCSYYFLPWPSEEAGLKERLAALTGLVKETFGNDPLPDIVIPNYRSSDFAAEVVDFTLASKADAMMVVSHPGITGFGPPTWEERLMFNEAQIPVICINTGFVMQYPSGDL